MPSALGLHRCHKELSLLFHALQMGFGTETCTLSSLLLFSFFCLVLGLMNACPGRGRGQEQGLGPTGGQSCPGRCSLCLGQLEMVVKSELEDAQACRRVSAWVGLHQSLTAICKVLVFLKFNKMLTLMVMY